MLILPALHLPQDGSKRLRDRLVLRLERLRHGAGKHDACDVRHKIIKMRPMHVAWHFGAHERPSRSSAIPASPHACGLTYVRAVNCRCADRFQRGSGNSAWVKAAAGAEPTLCSPSAWEPQGAPTRIRPLAWFY